MTKNKIVWPNKMTHVRPTHSSKLIDIKGPSLLSLLREARWFICIGIGGTIGIILSDLFL